MLVATEVAPQRAPPPGPREPLQLLVIEDSPAYATFVEQMVRDALGVAVEVVHRDAVSGARAALAEHEIDCVLLDLSLPDARGLEALDVVQSAAPDVPVVVLTGSEDLALAVRAVHEGAQDFLVKRTADRELLARSVRYAIERKEAEGRLAHQTLHDSLTALPNRILLLDRLNVALARARRRPTSVAILFLDLDRFKRVNDSLGHDAGDELLIELAVRLRGALRPSDTVARFGGDEFLILCEDLYAEREAVRIADRVRAVIAEPFDLRGHEVSVPASVGIACARPGDSATAQALLSDADAAMYRAKRNGTGIELFEAAMHAEAMTELETEHRLRLAVVRDELRLHYQPQLYLLGNRGAFGFEALLRWMHPQRGLMAPAEFIEIAEETGLIVPIGEWVLSEACRQLSTWRKQGQVPPQFTVSVNLSLRQLNSPRLTAAVGHALEVSQLPPDCLCLEVTESCTAKDALRVATVLDELKQLGVTLALDDFGTGYSSLSALSTYPLDIVKIDRSFVGSVNGDAAASRMLGAVLGVARAAELQAIAEGIETTEQLQLLQRLGCERGQGLLFARPAPADEALRWLDASNDPGM